ncbi:uncharacterized protein LOC135482553 [Lineus longissimus]|uniref:uncharacterized protein LOC135482553 n=1 Tax=Lineus longissimus TaxID=88925 RepID=UPI002B4DB67A
MLLRAIILSGALLTTRATVVENARSAANVTLPFRLTFNPLFINQLPMEDEWPVQVYFEDTTVSKSSDLVLGVQSKHPAIANVPFPLLDLHNVDELPQLNVTDTTNFTASGNFTVRGIFLGYSELIFHICNRSKSLCNDSIFPNPYDETGSYVGADSQWTTLDVKYRLSVMRNRTVLDEVFVVTVSIAVFVSQIAVGCKTELEVIKEVLKKPIAPVIGFFCQFCIMPPLAFGIGKLLSVSAGEAVGIFTLGCSPGGGSSNMYSYLLLGDVSLSITMTLISTIASLGMLPLWMFTLGELLLAELGMGDVTIPYENIIISLVMVIIPVGIGLIIKRYRPLWAKKIAKIIRPFMIIFLLFMFTFGIYVNLYMFKLFTPNVVGAGLLFPLGGFLGGAAIAAICRQPWKRVKTIALETGIQNTGVAMILLLFSLPSPDAEFSIVGAVGITMFMPLYPLIMVAVYEIRRCCQKKKKEGDADIDGEGGEIEGEKIPAEPAGFATFINKYKRFLPCIKKAESDKGPNTGDEKKELPNGIAMDVKEGAMKNEGAEKPSKTPDVSLKEPETDGPAAGQETPPNGQEDSVMDGYESGEVDNSGLDNSVINIGFVNDTGADTSL